MDYVQKGRQIFTEKGKLAATLDDDGNPVMAEGMAGAHSKGVKEFLEKTEVDLSDKSDVKDEEDGATFYVGAIPAQHVDEPEQDLPVSTPAQYLASDIPEEDLPPFSNEFGVNTPGFQEYVKKHKLNNEEVAAIIARITKH